MQRRGFIAAAVTAALTSRAQAMLLPFGFGIGATPTGGSTPSITTSTSLSATVGTTLSQSLAASGGSGSYSFHRVQSYPNFGGWCQVDGSKIVGTPQMNGTETCIVQVTDLVSGLSSQATFTITVSVSGSLAIVTSATALAGRNNAINARQYIASGGKPPYRWSQATVTQPWWVTATGWELGTPSSTGSVSMGTVTCTDSSGATATFSPGRTIASGMSFQGIDPDTGYLNVPFGWSGSKYKHPFLVYGSSGTAAISITSGSLHTGLSLTSGVITGTPTQTGARLITIQATDGVNSPITAQVLLTCLNASFGARPSGNTGTTTSYVDANGILRDPNGQEFRYRGGDRNHYDSAAWTSNTNGALSGMNAVRQFFGFGQFNQTVTAINTQISGEYLANKIFPIVTVANVQADCTASCSGTTLTVTAMDSTISPSNCGIMVVGMSLSATGITGTQPKILSGPTSGLTGAYTLDTPYTFGSQTVVGSMFLTNCSDPNGVVGATKMLVQALGAGMLTALTDGAINIANEWSAPSRSVWQSTYTTAIAAIRAAGFIGPIVIDAPSGGQDWGAFVSNGAALVATDAQKNVILSFHLYGGTDNATASITNVVSSGSNTVVTISSTLTHSQFDFFNIFPSNTYNGLTGYVLSGVQGMTAINGLQPCSTGNLGGTSGSWTVTLSVNSSGFGAYTGGGTIVTQNNYLYALSQLAALRAASGLCVIVGEFGPGQNVGASPTLVTPAEAITTCEAYQIPWLYWAWDDVANGPGGNQCHWQPSLGFGMTGPDGTTYQNGQYVTSDPTSLTGNGIDVLGNPRYGLCVLAAPQSSTL